MNPPPFRVTAVELYERPVALRIPFRFGAATVTRAPQAFVRASIVFEEGGTARGAAAELMIPKWFDKSPKKSNSENIDDLRRSLAAAANAYVAENRALTAFGHFAAHYAALIGSGAGVGLNPLTANYGAAVIDRAILDALCRALGVSFHAAIRANLPGIDVSLTPDLADFDTDRFLADLRPSSAIAARHTVGMLDPLAAGDATLRVGDGLPETLGDVIGIYGNRYFKLKLGGNPHVDVERLVRIAAVLDRLPEYTVTLDGNEQYVDALGIAELWRKVEATPDLADLARTKPLLVDESDATLDAFPMARAAGYTGVSSKSCKGIYKSLLNAARCAHWNTGSAPRYFLSGEDLTMQAGLAVQQDLALAVLLGLRHVERNGHHYVDGFAGQGARDAEQRDFLAAQPGLYERSHGSVRLAIRDGVIDISSLEAPGYASGAEPDWATLEPLGVAAVAAN